MSLQRTGFREWTQQVESTQNRLGRFVGSNAIKWFTGLPPKTSVADWIAHGDIALVNLKPSPHLSPESGRLFAAMLLHAFLNEAITHSDEEREYYLILDECQNFVTEDAAAMLDQVTKSGLRLTFSHHHPQQFRPEIREHIMSSLNINAGIKVIFRGLQVEDAKRYAEEFWYDQANERWVKEMIYGTTHDYELEEYETESESETESSSEIEHDGFADGDSFMESKGTFGENETETTASGFSFGSSSGTSKGSTQSSSRGTSRSTRYAPRARQELRSINEWSREDKIAQLASNLLKLGTGEACVKTPDGVLNYHVPHVEDYALLCPRNVSEFKKALQKQLIPRNEAEQILRDAEKRFLARSQGYESNGSRPKKRPARLCPQG